jgi:hypothetical protein
MTKTKAHTELRKAAQLLLSSVKTPARKGQAYRVGHGPLIRLEKALEAADDESRTVPYMFSPEAVCERAKSRREVLRKVLESPAPDVWKVQQAKLFLEEADGDTVVEGTE